MVRDSILSGQKTRSILLAEVALASLLIRPRAWWYNKVPLSVLLVFFLLAGNPFSPFGIVALIGVIGVVCGVANYGYALNELFDLEEDRRAGRNNSAAGRTRGDMWLIIAGSAVFALTVAGLVGHLEAVALTSAVLLLPLTYSVPPFRTKERGWAGVLSDALAAHVFPAALALTVMTKLSLPTLGTDVQTAILVWAFATGLRGILSHQLHDGKRDLSAGLMTVAHRYGHDRLSFFVICFILPIETGFLLAAVFLLPDHPAMTLAAVSFCMVEGARFWLGRQPLYRFTTWWRGYIPFADEGFYKVWGPLALGTDLSFSSPLYAPLLLLFVGLFWPRIQTEWSQMRALRVELREKLYGR